MRVVVVHEIPPPGGPRLSDPERLDVNPDVLVEKFIDHLVRKYRLPFFVRELGGPVEYELFEMMSGAKLSHNERIGNRVRSDASLDLRVKPRPDLLSNEDVGVAGFHLAGEWSVKGFACLLARIRTTYIQLYAQNELLVEFVREGRAALQENSVQERASSLLKWAKLRDRLLIGRIELASPGILEVIGALNPLETIARYLRERRQDLLEQRKFQLEVQKDASYRNAIDKVKQELEVESQRTKVAKERVEMLRCAAFSDEEIRTQIGSVLLGMERMDTYQATGRLKEVAVRRITSGD